MHIIGQPKSIDELEILSIEDIRGIAQFIDKEIRSGTPVDLPQAMTLRDMGRLFRSAITFHEQCAALQARLDLLSPDNQPPQIGRLFIPPVPPKETA
jgi:hypothetical protein